MSDSTASLITSLQIKNKVKESEGGRDLEISRLEIFRPKMEDGDCVRTCLWKKENKTRMNSISMERFYKINKH